VLVYIDDIIIFNQLLEEYLRYVNEVLTKLKTSGVLLFIKKYYFAYLNIKLLGHHISRLEYTIKNKKIKTIRNKAFLIILKRLKTGVNFFGYYYKFIKKFAVIIELILRLKTIGFKTYPIKRKSRERYTSNTKIRLNPNLERIPPEIRRRIIKSAEKI
jgi:hypothetical protein